MKYNFNELIPRRGTNCYKWDNATNDGVLPMWVADMDFRCAPAIIEALQRRAAHGIFGYTKVPQAYYDAVVNWFRRRHNWTTQSEWIIYTLGVVPALSAIIKALTQPGDGVLIQTPVYNCFFSSILNNACEVVENQLTYANKTYTVDFDDLERKASDPKVKLLLLCNPHNPAGRVWTREELLEIGNICIRNNVIVLADEIHCELVPVNHKYTPFASLSDDFLQHSVTCNSPSKSFNIAGLQIANIIAPDAEMRRKIERAININELSQVNPFGVEALMAAYNQSEDWLDELNVYIYDNYLYMKDFCETRLPRFPLTTLEGTYLAWMNCSVLKMTSAELEEQLLAKENLQLNPGTMYGAAGEGFMRWNLACPRARVEDGLQRFEHFARTQL